MKRMLYAAIALFAFSISPMSASAGEWKAVAVNDAMADIEFWGAVETAPDEEIARTKAIAACEQITGRTCRSVLTSSVPMSWHLVASMCNGVSATGGSRFDAQAANTRAAMMLGYSDGAVCTRVWTFPPGCADTKCGRMRK